MDVTSISGASAYAQQQVANKVSTSVMAKVHDEQKQQGSDVLQLLQAATVPPTPGNLDVKA